MFLTIQSIGVTHQSVQGILLQNSKCEILRRCFELGEDAEYVSREIGYSRMSLYVWRRNYLKHGMVGLMAKREISQENHYIK